MSDDDVDSACRSAQELRETVAAHILSCPSQYSEVCTMMLFVMIGRVRQAG